MCVRGCVCLCVCVSLSFTQLTSPLDAGDCILLALGLVSDHGVHDDGLGDAVGNANVTNQHQLGHAVGKRACLCVCSNVYVSECVCVRKRERESVCVCV